MSLIQMVVAGVTGAQDSGQGNNIAITIDTNSFTSGDPIPGDHKNNVGGQCTGANNSVQLEWTVTGTHGQVSELNLECWDINGGSGSSRSGHFRHWFVTGLSATPGTYTLAENADWGGSNPAGTPSGSDFGGGDRSNGWGGPCPPSGTHNYRIQIYPVDSNGNEVTGGVNYGTIVFTSS